MARVEKNLTHLIGPMARHLIKNAGQRSNTAAEFRSHLLALIPAKADQENFLKACGDIFSTIEIPAPASAPNLAPVAAPVTPAGSAFVWEPSVLDRARKDLAHHIGPMAKLLVDRAAAKTKTPEALYEMLAGEIHSPAEREKFQKSAPR